MFRLLRKAVVTPAVGQSFYRQHHLHLATAVNYTVIGEGRDATRWGGY